MKSMNHGSAFNEDKLGIECIAAKGAPRQDEFSVPMVVKSE